MRFDDIYRSGSGRSRTRDVDAVTRRTRALLRSSPYDVLPRSNEDVTRLLFTRRFSDVVAANNARSSADSLLIDGKKIRAKKTMKFIAKKKRGPWI